MISQVGFNPQVLYLLSPRHCHTAELLLALDAAESSSAQIGGNTRRSAAREGVHHPVALVSTCQYDARQQGERLLRWMLAARLLPSADGRQSPHVGHLLPVVQPFHHVVVKLMRHLL